MHYCYLSPLFISQGVLSLAVLADGHLVSGSQDKTVRIWNLVSGTCDRVLDGHTGVRENGGYG